MHPCRAAVLVPLATIAALSGATAAPAQELPPLVVEPRAGTALPVASFRTGPDQGGEIARAPTFGLHFVFRGPSGWGPYVGFSQHRFDCGADGCPGTEYVTTVWDVGTQRTLGAFGWVRAGLVWGRMEREFASLGPRTSSLGLGAEGGLGLRVPMSGRLALMPGVHYGWLNTRFRDDALMRLRWVSADVGLAIGF